MTPAKLRIKEIKKLDVQAQNETILDVEIELYLVEGATSEQPATTTVIESRKLGFPLGTSEDELKADLQKFLESYNSDSELAEKNKALDEMHAKADETIASLTGAEI